MGSSNLKEWLKALTDLVYAKKDNLIRLEKQILDTRFEVFFSNQDYANLFRSNVASHPLKDDLGTIQVFCVDASYLGIELPTWPAHFYERNMVQNQFAELGYRGHYLHEPRTWQFYSEQNKLGIQIISSANQYAPWETGAPLRSFIHWGIGNRTRQVCHAATLGFDGNAIILGGAGGSGKSGTTLSGIINGLSSVGDDYVILEKSQQIYAYPIFNILKQDTEGIKRVCPEKIGDFGLLNWQNKFEIHFSKLADCNFVDKLAVRAILIPRIANLSKSKISPISKAHAMRALAPSSTFQLPDGEIEGIGFIAELCRTLPCFEIALSTNPKEISGTIQSFISGNINE